MKSRAPQLHLEYRFYKSLGTTGKPGDPCVSPPGVWDRMTMLRLFWKVASLPQQAITALRFTY